MAEALLELEGTWEEILQRAPELAGRRVHVTVLPSERETAPQEKPLPRKNQEMLELLDEYYSTPLTKEEIAVLDEMEQFIKEHPFSLRQIEDEP